MSMLTQKQFSTNPAVYFPGAKQLCFCTLREFASLTTLIWYSILNHTFNMIAIIIGI